MNRNALQDDTPETHYLIGRTFIGKLTVILKTKGLSPL